MGRWSWRLGRCEWKYIMTCTALCCFITDWLKVKNQLRMPCLSAAFYNAIVIFLLTAPFCTVACRGCYSNVKIVFQFLWLPWTLKCGNCNFGLLTIRFQSSLLRDFVHVFNCLLYPYFIPSFVSSFPYVIFNLALCSLCHIPSVTSWNNVVIK